MVNWVPEKEEATYCYSFFPKDNRLSRPAIAALRRLGRDRSARCTSDESRDGEQGSDFSVHFFNVSSV